MYAFVEGAERDLLVLDKRKTDLHGASELSGAGHDHKRRLLHSGRAGQQQTTAAAAEFERLGQLQLQPAVRGVHYCVAQHQLQLDKIAVEHHCNKRTGRIENHLQGNIRVYANNFISKTFFSKPHYLKQLAF